MGGCSVRVPELIHSLVTAVSRKSGSNYVSTIKDLKYEFFTQKETGEIMKVGYQFPTPPTPVKLSTG